MVTAMLATANLLNGARYDVWAVNNEDLYLEQIVPSDAETPSVIPTPPGSEEPVLLDTTILATAQPSFSPTSEPGPIHSG